MHFFLKKYIFFILLTWTVVDLTTGVFLRYNIPPFNSISFGTIIRLPLLLVIIVSGLYYSNKVQLIILLSAITLLIVLVFKFAIIDKETKYLQTLVKFSSVIFFLPILAHLRKIDFLDDFKINRIITFNLIVFSVNILLSLFGIGFSKYGTSEDGIMIGSSGFFYAGNELNTAIILLFSSLLLYQRKKTKREFIVKFIFFIFLSLLSLSKTFILGVLIVGYIYWISYYKTNKVILVSIFLIFFIPVMWYVVQLPTLATYIDSIGYFYDKYDNFLDFITSGRYSRLSAFEDVSFFEHSSYLLWGTTMPNDPNLTFEMDFVELLFYNGLLGIIILLLFWIQVAIQYRKLIFKADKRFFLRIFILFNLIAFIAGHSFASQMALPYLLLILIYPSVKRSAIPKTTAFS